MDVKETVAVEQERRMPASEGNDKGKCTGINRWRWSATNRQRADSCKREVLPKLGLWTNIQLKDNQKIESISLMLEIMEEDSTRTASRVKAYASNRQKWEQIVKMASDNRHPVHNLWRRRWWSIMKSSGNHVDMQSNFSVLNYYMATSCSHTYGPSFASHLERLHNYWMWWEIAAWQANCFRDSGWSPEHCDLSGEWRVPSPLTNSWQDGYSATEISHSQIKWNQDKIIIETKFAHCTSQPNFKPFHLNFTMQISWI